MKLSSNEFWQLTLAQLDALIKAYNAEQEQLDFRAALVCAVIANVNRDPKKRPRPFAAKDFMPKRKAEKMKPQSTEQMMTTIQILNAAFGGKEQ